MRRSDWATPPHRRKTHGRVSTATAGECRGQRAAEVPAVVVGTHPSAWCGSVHLARAETGVRAAAALHLPPSIHPSLHLSEYFSCYCIMDTVSPVLRVPRANSSTLRSDARSRNWRRIAAGAASHWPRVFLRNRLGCRMGASIPMRPAHSCRSMQTATECRFTFPALGHWVLAHFAALRRPYPSKNPSQGVCCFMSDSYFRARAGPGSGPNLLAEG